jgi:hypothetical protein
MVKIMCLDLTTAVVDHGIEYIMSRTIVVDMDGVITDFYHCKEKCQYKGYPHGRENLKRNCCPVMPGAVEKLTKYKSLGFWILIFTGRVEEERDVTEKWLKDNKIPYDILAMNKPRGFIYIDDFGFRFTSWEDVDEFIMKVKKL